MKNENTNRHDAQFNLKAEEVISALLARRPEDPIHAYIGEVSYGGNLFGIVSDGPWRHLEEITETDEYFPDRLTCSIGYVIPWTIENGRELAILGMADDDGIIGLLIDYRVEDREKIWRDLSVKSRARLKEIMARNEDADWEDTIYQACQTEDGEWIEIPVGKRSESQPDDGNPPPHAA